MKPVACFHPREQLLQSPHPDIGALPVVEVAFEGFGNGWVSCWRLSWRERLAALLGRPVYLAVLGFGGHPPVLLTVERQEVIPPDGGKP